MISPNPRTIRGILFDFDGTLVDTAPDLADALNRLREENNLAALPYPILRPYASQGARGLIGIGLGISTLDQQFSTLRNRFLDFYSERICRKTVLFPGIDQLLEQIEAVQLPWGIVTNKVQRFTGPLCSALGFDKRATCIVSGDTCARAKPAPDPLIHAAELIDIPTEACVYIGDDFRDIQAGQAAGMQTIAVRYGYLGDGPAIETWGADFIAKDVADIAAYCL